MDKHSGSIPIRQLLPFAFWWRVIPVPTRRISGFAGRASISTASVFTAPRLLPLLPPAFPVGLAIFIPPFLMVFIASGEHELSHSDNRVSVVVGEEPNVFTQ